MQHGGGRHKLECGALHRLCRTGLLHLLKPILDRAYLLFSRNGKAMGMGGVTGNTGTDDVEQGGI